MASNCLHDWLLDPLFGPAEDVQGSADRLESNFRTWQQDIQEQKKTEGEVESQRLRLMSACDTLRWQLEVFERAVRKDTSARGNASLEASARKRRQEFVDIIRQQLQGIEVLVRGVPGTAVGQCPSKGSLVEAGVTKESTIEVAMPTSRQLAAAALSRSLLLPGETAAAAPPNGSPGSYLSGFFGSSRLSPSRAQDPATAPLAAALTGFLGTPSSPDSLLETACHHRSVPLHADEGRWGFAQQGQPSRGAEAGGAAGEKGVGSLDSLEHLESLESLSLLLPELEGEGSPGEACPSSPDDEGDDALPSPGPDTKSFPSLLEHQGHHQGAWGGPHGARVHGWQCLLFWVSHAQRLARRRQIEHSKSRSTDQHPLQKKQEAAGDWPRDHLGHGVVASSRCDAAHGYPIVRSSSSTSLGGSDPANRTEWHMDVPAATLPVTEADTISGKNGKPAQWHFAARPRRTSTAVVSRPARPYSRFVLACAAAVFMLAVACYCRMSEVQGGGGGDLRHTSFLEVPASAFRAFSPAIP